MPFLSTYCEGYLGLFLILLTFFGRPDPRLRPQYATPSEPFQSQDRQYQARDPRAPDQRSPERDRSSDYMPQEPTYPSESGRARQSAAFQPRENVFASQPSSGNDAYSASVPLYDTRPPGEPSQRRDADGGYGMPGVVCTLKASPPPVMNYFLSTCVFCTMNRADGI